MNLKGSKVLEGGWRRGTGKKTGIGGWGGGIDGWGGGIGGWGGMGKKKNEPRRVG